MSPAMLILRSGSRVRADEVLRDGNTVSALCPTQRFVVDEATRTGYPIPAGRVWRTWQARDVLLVEEPEVAR